jgi:hypothetical protein
MICPIYKNIDDALLEQEELQNFKARKDQAILDEEIWRMRFFCGNGQIMDIETFRKIENADKMIPELDKLKKEFDKAFKQLNKELFAKR